MLRYSYGVFTLDLEKCDRDTANDVRRTQFGHTARGHSKCRRGAKPTISDHLRQGSNVNILALFTPPNRKKE